MKPLPTRFLLTLILFLSMVLSACSAQSRAVTFDRVTYQYQQTQGNSESYAAPDGKTLQIETAGDETRVTVNGQEYVVKGTETQLTVTFPDGRELTKQYEQNSSIGSTGLGVEASMQDWDRVDALREMVFHTAQNQKSNSVTWHFLLGAAIFGIGLFQVVNPRLAWQVSEGWRYVNVEPSELYMGVSRLAGVVLMLIALFVAFSG